MKIETERLILREFTVDDFDAKKRFIDCYENNRSYVLSAVYSDAHKFQSDYYDKFMI